MKSVYFILDSINTQRCFKRIEEFKDNGYDVKAFGFDRYENVPIDNKGNCEIIGSFPNSMPYSKRVNTIFKSLNRIFSQYRHDKSIIWYYFGEMVAIASFFINQKRTFIYEESDISTMNGYLLNKSKKLVINYIIKKSLLTIFTSEGFAKFHFGKIDNIPNNVFIKPNKVNRKILDFDSNADNYKFNVDNIKFGFVGFIRYKSIYNIANLISNKYPNHEFHFYGTFGSDSFEKMFKSLNSNNIYFHGAFKNPDDLPKIYKSIDVLVSCYDDINNLGVLYAEPNKLYESIFFRVPIIVSHGTYLAEKVEKMKAGIVVNSNIDQSIEHMVKYIENNYSELYANLSKIPIDFAIDSADKMFERLNSYLS